MEGCEAMTTENSTAVANGLEAHAGLYLAFKLANEMYGVEILVVQEIIQMVPVTKVPRMPEFVRGVINLRGKVIPVVDLRTNFGMASHEDTTETCIIVVEIASKGRMLTTGVVVDQVAEVTDVGVDQLEPPPAFGAAVDTTFLRGVAKVDDKVIMLLDIQRILGADEMAQMESLSTAAEPGTE
jgi:purine-binding chemotaxis protein CheW